MCVCQNSKWGILLDAQALGTAWRAVRCATAGRGRRPNHSIDLEFRWCLRVVEPLCRGCVTIESVLKSLYVDLRELVELSKVTTRTLETSRSSRERKANRSCVCRGGGRPQCATLVADELADALYCDAATRAQWTAAAERGLVAAPPRAFRFYHGRFYFDSEEYELLRGLFTRLDLVRESGA